MKITDCKVGMEVTSTVNDFGVVYEIDRLRPDGQVDVHVVPIEQIMIGGKMVDRPCKFTCYPHILKEKP